VLSSDSNVLAAVHRLLFLGLKMLFVRISVAPHVPSDELLTNSSCAVENVGARFISPFGRSEYEIASIRKFLKMLVSYSNIKYEAGTIQKSPRAGWSGDPIVTFFQTAMM